MAGNAVPPPASEAEIVEAACREVDALTPAVPAMFEGPPSATCACGEAKHPGVKHFRWEGRKTMACTGVGWVNEYGPWPLPPRASDDASETRFAVKAVGVALAVVAAGLAAGALDFKAIREREAADARWRAAHHCAVTVVRNGYVVRWICDGGVEWVRD